MSQLAAELGHSLLFPVQCRYCGDDIYLFAEPNGGFAMFEDVGPPWPKHRCPRMPNDPAPYCLPPVAYLPDYDMPIPMKIEFAPYDNGRILEGIVVRVRPASVSRIAGDVTDVVLYNGRALFKICARRVLPIGAFITGIATFIPGIGTCLEKVGHTSRQ